MLSTDFHSADIPLLRATCVMIQQRVRGRYSTDPSCHTQDTRTCCYSSVSSLTARSIVTMNRSLGYFNSSFSPQFFATQFSFGGCVYSLICLRSPAALPHQQYRCTHHTPRLSHSTVELGTRLSHHHTQCQYTGVHRHGQQL